MKVSQLIEALQSMPPDADIITHANNHTAGRDDTMRVGLVREVNNRGEPVVCVGNWSAYHLPKEGFCYRYEAAGRVFRAHGERSATQLNWPTELVEEEAAKVDAVNLPRTTYEYQPAHFELKAKT
jgi:ribosomal protein L35AE/L33A